VIRPRRGGPRSVADPARRRFPAMCDQPVRENSSFPHTLSTWRDSGAAASAIDRASHIGRPISTGLVGGPCAPSPRRIADRRSRLPACSHKFPAYEVAGLCLRNCKCSTGGERARRAWVRLAAAVAESRAPLTPRVSPVVRFNSDTGPVKPVSVHVAEGASLVAVLPTLLSHTSSACRQLDPLDLIVRVRRKPFFESPCAPCGSISRPRLFGISSTLGGERLDLPPSRPARSAP